ncbi:MAG: hypothetical protein QW589_04535 [Candidatus Bathyarchaeia archaeon]
MKENQNNIDEYKKLLEEIFDLASYALIITDMKKILYIAMRKHGKCLGAHQKMI